jgi:hypothetical protein
MREVSSNNTINQYINYIEEFINNSYLNPKEAQSQIYEYLSVFGIHIDDSSSPLVLFACSMLILSIIVLLCFINILIYVIVILLVDKNNDKLVE